MTSKKVLIYSTPTCPYCMYAKDFFIEKGVDFDYIDVSNNHDMAMEMIRKSGQRGVPVIDIDGHVIVGFQPEVFENIINKRNQ